MIGILLFSGTYLLMEGFDILPDQWVRWIWVMVGLAFLARAVDLMFRGRSKP